MATLHSLITTHYLLSVSLCDGSNKDLEKMWKKLSKTDVALIQIHEMEADMKLLFAYAVGPSHQSNTLNSSLLPCYRMQ